ncbi:MAG: hypothetical protein Q7T51_03465 [Candidatus Moranbacteria bacterium]|nr:hypothetical protein [Candidatus Moranbacteria bacterium]
MKYQKRKIKNIGLFNRIGIKGNKLPSEKLQQIYQLLLSKGFRETRWQFIYEGQLAGLVKPYSCGKNEIHVRFYDDRIFAEFEIGRAYIQHFLGPRLNANGYLFSLLVNHFSELNDIKWLEELFSTENQTIDELSMRIWDVNKTEDPFLYKRQQENILRASTLFVLSNFFIGWKWAYSIIVIGISIYVFKFSIEYLVLLPLMAILLTPFLPHKGKP